jgi:hypothetical protein
MIASKVSLASTELSMGYIAAVSVSPYVAYSGWSFGSSVAPPRIYLCSEYWAPPRVTPQDFGNRLPHSITKTNHSSCADFIIIMTKFWNLCYCWRGKGMLVETVDVPIGYFPMVGHWLLWDALGTAWTKLQPFDRDSSSTSNPLSFLFLFSNPR